MKTAWVVLLIPLLLSSCTSPLKFNRENLIRPSYLLVGGSNTVIQAVDGSFVATSGKAIATPFLSHCWGKDNRGKATAEIPKEAFFVGAPKSKLATLGAELAQRYKQAIKAKARPVIIRLPYLNRPLYGLLLLCPRHKTEFPGPANYDISIPKTIVASALREERTVTFQVIFGRNRPDKIYYSWILWLSKRPF